MVGCLLSYLSIVWRYPNTTGKLGNMRLLLAVTESVHVVAIGFTVHTLPVLSAHDLNRRELELLEPTQ
jgi:hypothetical protein